MATLVYLSFDLRERQAECVRAGHPPPLVRHPSGEVTELAIEGSLPIGVSQGPCPTTTVQIEPGSLVLLYTDGLVERRGDGIKPGLDKLKRALRAGPAEPEPCLDFVLHALTPTGSEDDVALLLMRVERTTDEPFELTTPAQPSALAPIRRAVEAWLADQRIDQSRRVADRRRLQRGLRQRLRARLPALGNRVDRGRGAKGGPSHRRGRERSRPVARPAGPEPRQRLHFDELLHGPRRRRTIAGGNHGPHGAHARQG